MENAHRYAEGLSSTVLSSTLTCRASMFLKCCAVLQNPQKETGFILNRSEHWFSLRRLGQHWWVHLLSPPCITLSLLFAWHVRALSPSRARFLSLSSSLVCYACTPSHMLPLSGAPVSANTLLVQLSLSFLFPICDCLNLCFVLPFTHHLSRSVSLLLVH